ncbi:hypothetical protein LEP1GSC021_1088 [Leptospira noguchii str. 1993005606]|nr:hypothetical protein LEP1GSC021_1088 [Leptospira noguchii str. 1993005606]
MTTVKKRCSIRRISWVALTQQNAFLNSMHRSLRVALQGRVNSAKRFPKGRVLG